MIPEARTNIAQRPYGDEIAEAEGSPELLHQVVLAGGIILRIRSEKIDEHHGVRIGLVFDADFVPVDVGLEYIGNLQAPEEPDGKSMPFWQYNAIISATLPAFKDKETDGQST
jgi:hypothetical protein